MVQALPGSLSSNMQPCLDLKSLAEAYSAGLHPEQLVRYLYEQLIGCKSPIFIHLAPLEQLIKRAHSIQSIPLAERSLLWGVPCAVKDNVDVAAMPTTAACPTFAYTPAVSAPAVKALEESGVIIVGKTNMDQFAAGLVGTRSPHGAVATPFDSRFISGGSSSGSAAAVGAGLVTFALGTDTAGSGRVPAGLCGCVGIKGTLGSVSTVGVVPACASLDCLTVFARNVSDAAVVMRVMKSAHAGSKDVWRRPSPPIVPQLPAVGFRFAAPSLTRSDWLGPGGPAAATAYAAQFDAAIQRMIGIGGTQVHIDFKPFLDAAAMLYGTAFVAERYSGIRTFLEVHVNQESGRTTMAENDQLYPVTRAIISNAGKFTAADVYDANAKLAVLKAAATVELERVDCLLVPTTLSHYTIQEIQAEEDTPEPQWTQNANLGRFTNFVNLLDMCGVAIPSGLVEVDAEKADHEAQAAGEVGGLTDQEVKAVRNRADYLRKSGSTKVTLPFGVTLLSKAWHDEWLWGIGMTMHNASGLGCGPTLGLTRLG